MPTDHTAALVPIHVWEYSSPFLKYQGEAADIGLFAESLLWYERVQVDIAKPEEFEALVAWFYQSEHHIKHLLDLLSEGAITFSHHAFVSVAPQFVDSGEYAIVNVQDEEQIKVGYGLGKVFYGPRLDFVPSNQRAALYKLLASNYREYHAEDYGPPITDAQEAVRHPGRLNLLLQVFLDEMYSKLGKEFVPQVSTSVVENADGSRRIEWGQAIQKAIHIAPGKINFAVHTPLYGEADSNKLIWTASQIGLDLFLGDVQSTLAGRRLLVASEHLGKTQALVNQLEQRVEFPDIRREVNNGKLDATKVIEIRKNAAKFRTWLQCESGKDRDSIIYYHQEVAKRSGLTRAVSSTLKLVSLAINVAPVAYPVVTRDLSPEPPLVIASGAMAASVFLDTVAGSLRAGWKPIMFGDSLKKEVEIFRIENRE